MPRHTHASNALSAERRELEKLSPLERITAAADMIENHRIAMNELAMTRRRAMRQALDEEGLSAIELANRLGVTRQAIYRLLAGED